MIRILTTIASLLVALLHGLRKLQADSSDRQSDSGLMFFTLSLGWPLLLAVQPGRDAARCHR